MKTLQIIFIFFLFIISLNAKNKKIDFENIIIETPQNTKNKTQYEQKSILRTPPKPLNKEKHLNKKDKINIDGDVKVNKKEKKVDSVKANIGLKF